MDYQIQITESLQRVATVSADSEIEAVELVRRLYKEEKIVLDSEDFTDANFIVKNQNLKTYYQSEKRDFVAQRIFPVCRDVEKCSDISS